MARTVQYARIESPTARAKLARGRRYHFQSLITGRAALGYHRNEGASHGRWLLQRYLGGEKYSRIPLGAADDVVQADGKHVLNFEQAKAKALELLSRGSESMPKGSLTVRKSFARYLEYLESQGRRTLETERRGAALILPELGDLRLDELTSERLRKWLSWMVNRPALLRSKTGGKKNTKPKPEDEDAIRKRRASANRVWTMLRASLNHAFDEGLVAHREAWTRVRPFKNVDVARTRYLQVAEAKRLINACDPDFRQVVQAALQSGARYGELCRLRVRDFNCDSGTLAIWKSKSGKPRHVVLTSEGVDFFAEITSGRTGSEFMLRNQGRIHRALERERQRLEKDGKDPNEAKVDDDGDWRAAEQARPMREACERAKIEPPVGVHALRHTWASLSAMSGVPLPVIAHQLGHADGRMTERHYAHLAPSFVADAIRQGAPRFGFEASKKVVVFKPRSTATRQLEPA